MKIILLPCLTFMYVTLINDMPWPVTARRAEEKCDGGRQSFWSSAPHVSFDVGESVRQLQVTIRNQPHEVSVMSEIDWVSHER